MSALDRLTGHARRAPRLDADEERELVRRHREGDRGASERLVEACLPMVLAIAREYARSGVPLEDLAQQGSIGLLAAAERFDVERGVRLSSYAARWVRGEVRAYATRFQRIVRLGSTHSERVAVRAWWKGEARDAEALSTRSGMPIARARALADLLSRRELSLDASAAESGAELHERVASAGPDPEQALAACERERRLHDALARGLGELDERERHILAARFWEEEPRTFDELGREMGVSRERVRQLEKRARERLRSALRDVA